MAEQNSNDIVAAHDYRSQQQRRYGEDEARRFIELANTKFDEGLAHLQKMYPDLTAEDLTRELSSHKGFMTEFDDPLSHWKVVSHCELIEQAAKENDLPLHGGVSAGALHSSGLAAMQQRVMMTESSVIMITVDLILLIHRLSKLITLSMPIEGGGDEFRPLYDSDLIAAQVNKSPILQSEWINFFCDYSFSYNHKCAYHGGPIFVHGKERQTLLDDFDESMSLFVVGHEYGHHIDKHSLGDYVSVYGPDKESQHQDELVADMLATMLSCSAGQLTGRPNWCALTGVGAVSILTVLEYIRRGNKILETGNIESTITRHSHPPLEDRLKVVRAVVTNFCGDNGSATALRMQDGIKSLIDLAWLSASKTLLNAHRGGIRPLKEQPQGWLPNKN